MRDDVRNHFINNAARTSAHLDAMSDIDVYEMSMRKLLLQKNVTKSEFITNAGILNFYKFFYTFFTLRPPTPRHHCNRSGNNDVSPLFKCIKLRLTPPPLHLVACTPFHVHHKCRSAFMFPHRSPLLHMERALKFECHNVCSVKM